MRPSALCSWLILWGLARPQGLTGPGHVGIRMDSRTMVSAAWAAAWAQGTGLWGRRPAGHKGWPVRTGLFLMSLRLEGDKKRLQGVPQVEGEDRDASRKGGMRWGFDLLSNQRNAGAFSKVRHRVSAYMGAQFPSWLCGKEPNWHP